MAEEISAAQATINSMIGAVETTVETPIVAENGAVNNPTETTATPTTITEPTTTTVTEQPKFEDLLQKEFGADVNTVKERFTKYDELEKQLKELSSKPTYKTDYGKQIDEWLANGVSIENIARFGKMDLKTMDADAKIRTMLELQNPHLTPQHIDAIFESKYHGDDLDTDNAKLLKEAEKLQAAVQAETFLSDYIGKQFSAPSDEPDPKVLLQQAQIKEFWTTQTPTLAKSLEKISFNAEIPVIGQKGQESIKVDIALDIPKETLSAITERATLSAIAAGLPNTEESAKEVQAYIKSLVWAEHGETLLQNYAAKREEAIWAHVQKTFDNPTAFGQRTIVDNQSSIMAGIMQHATQASTR